MIVRQSGNRLLPENKTFQCFTCGFLQILRHIRSEILPDDCITVVVDPECHVAMVPDICILSVVKWSSFQEKIRWLHIIRDDDVIIEIDKLFRKPRNSVEIILNNAGIEGRQVPCIYEILMFYTDKLLISCIQPDRLLPASNKIYTVYPWCMRLY